MGHQGTGWSSDPEPGVFPAYDRPCCWTGETLAGCLAPHSLMG